MAKPCISRISRVESCEMFLLDLLASRYWNPLKTTAAPNIHIMMIVPCAANMKLNSTCFKCLLCFMFLDFQKSNCKTVFFQIRLIVISRGAKTTCGQKPGEIGGLANVEVESLKSLENTYENTSFQWGAFGNTAKDG